MASVEPVLDTLVPCDPYHPALCINISVEPAVPLPINSHIFYNFHQASYPDINKFLLSFNWYDTFLSLDVNSATNTFYDALHSCILQFVPKVSFTPSKFPIWLLTQSIQPSVNSVLIDEQHGFRPGRSTITNSMIFNKYIFEAFEENLQVDTIYTDLSKAFDRVDHSALVQVLYKTGFGDPLLSWFRSYLSDRLQWIKINGHKSSVSFVPSGVPQGGHLSPLLFSLFLNGLKQIIPNCKFLVFADDLKLFMKIKSIDDCHLNQI